MAKAPELKLLLTVDSTKAERAIAKFEKTIQRSAKSIQSFGATLTRMSAQLKAIGSTAIDASLQIQNAVKKIRVGTGASGEELKKLINDFKAVAGRVPASLESTGQVIADLNTRLGVSGTDLQKIALNVQNAAEMTGESAATMASEVARAMNLMGVNARDSAAFMDKLFVAAQNTGIGMTQLSSELILHGAALQNMGLSQEQSIALLARFNKAGLDTAKIMSGLNIAMAKQGKKGTADFAAALQGMIDKVRNAATDTEAGNIAFREFGKSGLALKEAIRSGNFEIAELSDKLQKSRDAISENSKASQTFASRWATAMNDLKMQLQPLGDALISLNEEWVLPVMKAFNRFSDLLGGFAAKLGVAAVAAGPLIYFGGALLSTWGKLWSLWSKFALFLNSQLIPAFTAFIAKLIATKGALIGLNTAFTVSTGGALAIAGALTALVFGISSVISYFSNLNTAADSSSSHMDNLRAHVDKLAQSLAALSDRELTLKISDLQSKKQQLTAQIQKRTNEIEQQEQSSKSYFGGFLKGKESSKISLAEDDETLKELKKQAANVDVEITAGVDERSFRDASGYVAGIRQQFNNELRQAKTTEAARAIASRYVEQLGGKAKGFAEGSKTWREYHSAMEQINSTAQSYRPITPVKLSSAGVKTKASKEDLLERLRWQNSAKFLSDADYQAALTAHFQKLTGGKGYETWSKDARSVYDELERLKKSQASKTAETLKWQNSAGFLDDAEYAASLKDRLAGLTGGQGFGAWSEEARGVFDELQRVMSEQLAPSLDSLKERFANGQITLGEYQTQLESLKQSYESYPAITKELQKELDAAKKSSHTFLSGMTAAIKDAKNSFDNLSVTVGTGLADGFARAIAYGEDLGETLKKLGQDIIYTVTKMLILQSVTRMFSGLFGGGGENILPVATGYQLHFSGMDSGWEGLVAARGRAFGPAGVIPFARGGIVGRPTLFKFAGGTGLMGEAGPEAIMPLERDSHGRLGVYASGGAGGVFAPVINVNVENNGSGEMSERQANEMSRQLRDVVDARIADQLSQYKRRGFFRAGAYA